MCDFTAIRYMYALERGLTKVTTLPPTLGVELKPEILS